MIGLLPYRITMLPIPRSFISWLAAFSLVLNGMLPLASHAAMATGTMAICSSTVRVQSDVPLKSSSRGEHCIYCATSSDSPVILSGKVIHPLFCNPPAGMPASPASHPTPDARFSCAQPRAPPVHFV